MQGCTLWASRLGVVLLYSTWNILNREVHRLPVLPGKRHHFISTLRRATDAQASIAFGNETTCDRVEDLVENGVTYAPRPCVFN